MTGIAAGHAMGDTIFWQDADFRNKGRDHA